MEAPEYLDLDEIDFSEDSVYSVTSLKSVPELSRRSDGPNEDRPAPAINWSRGVSSHGGGGIKATGLAEVHSKFRPVKRVSPLKHQPETNNNDSESDAKAPEPTEGSKDDPGTDKTHASSSGPDSGPKTKTGNNPQGLFGELEHYDLDMDEILDVPYIKSSQMSSTTLPRVPQDKRSVTGSCVSAAGTLERNKRGAKGLTHSEALSLGGNSATTPYCVLSPVKWSDLRKSRSMDPDLHHLHRSGAAAGFNPPEGHCSGLLSCSSSVSSFSDADKLLSARVYPDVPRPAVEAGGSGLMFAQPGCTVPRQDPSKPWVSGGTAPELDEESKRNHNILNIVREGQISLLPHLAADNLELIRDEDNNNLLHVSASQGHCECLQHLTSLMGEDGLNERNSQQLTPAGLAVKNGHLECVRWMVSETEAIAELSCTREHPSLIHYAARHGQEKVLLWLLQFMQEQAISLDEVDQNGNSAVHVAAQYGHLTCIQTLVEYGSNVTVHNQQGERPSQSAERQGHTTCARYLVVVETCMSLASQVVKLTKQLNEQAAERMVVQKQLQRLMDPKKTEGTPSRSPGSHHAAVEAWPELLLTAEVNPGDSGWTVRQHQGRDPSEAACPRERLPPAGNQSRDAPLPPGSSSGPRRAGLVERRELKLARLKHIMHRSLSESDSEGVSGENQAQNSLYGYQPEDGKPPHTNVRPDRPSNLPLSPEDETVPDHLHLMMRKHLPHSNSTSDRKLAFSIRESKSVDSYCGYNEHNAADSKTPDACSTDEANKPATSPKSALKSPSSRRKTSQNLKLRVTFDEQMIHKSNNNNNSAPQQEAEPNKTHQKRSFGTFRSIMETLSGNSNHNNNNNNSTNSSNSAPSTNQNSPGRKGGSPGGGAKGKSRSSNV